MIIKEVYWICLCFFSHTIFSSITHNFLPLGNEEKSSSHPGLLHDFFATEDEAQTKPLLEQLENAAGSSSAPKLIVLDDSDSEHATASPSRKALRIAEDRHRFNTGLNHPDTASHQQHTHVFQQKHNLYPDFHTAIPSMASRAQNQIQIHEDIFNDLSDLWTYMNSVMSRFLAMSMPGVDPKAYQSLATWKFENVLLPLFIDGVIRVQMTFKKDKSYILPHEVGVLAKDFFKQQVKLSFDKAAEQLKHIVGDEPGADFTINGHKSMVLMCEFKNTYIELVEVAWRLVENWIPIHEKLLGRTLRIDFRELWKIHCIEWLNEKKRIIAIPTYEKKFQWPRSIYRLRKKYIAQVTVPNTHVKSGMQKTVRPQSHQGAPSPANLHYLLHQPSTQQSAPFTMSNTLSQKRQTLSPVGYVPDFQPVTLHNTNPHQASSANQKTTLDNWEIIHASPPTPIISTSPLGNGPLYHSEHAEGAVNDIIDLTRGYLETQPVKNIYEAAQRQRLMGDMENVMRCLRAVRIPKHSKGSVVKEVSR
ncbi:hypothetical protein DFH28DRAFT_1084668 [Melampsora americana]|nr:hypothetical protein DFH28DRAFT_1084668 [Melampsora americana]